MPPLTEAWAAEYLEVIVALLVFALGIPALILQFAVPDKLRLVSRTRLKVLRWSAFVVSFVMSLGALAFVWPLHPGSAGATLAEQVSRADDTHSRAGAAIIVFIVFLTLVFWLIQTKEHCREAIIRSLRKCCMENIRRRGILPERTLADIVYLGEQGEPGHEKKQVLEALDGLAAGVQSREQYTGYELEGLIQGVETTTLGGARVGDLDNFLRAAEVIEHILLRLQRPDLSAAPDTAIALWTLERLGVVSLALVPERAALAVLQVVASAAERQNGAFQFATERLFSIGRAALVDARCFLVAVAALSKLEASAERRTPLKGEVAADLLGLLAEFWASGDTARRHARSVLERVAGHFDPSLLDCMAAAIEHQYTTAHFDTADRLADMLQDLK
jgi:hypothetical protein